MTFLSPWAAWFLAGIPVIVLLYLLKLKRRPLPVSTLMFWDRVMHETRRRALFQRLRNLLSLLLHLLIFLLILGALARPTFDRFIAAGSSTVLILDTRARMQTLESGSESRFEKARRLAATYLRRASAHSQLAILTTAPAAQVASPFTGDEKALQESLTKLTVTDSASDLDSALHLADDLLASRRGDRRIILLSDRELPAATKIRAPISTIRIGESHDNVAIARFAARPLLASPQTSEVLLELQNFGRTVAKGNVEIAFDGRRLDVRPFELAPGAKRAEIFPSVPRPGRNSRGWLTTRLDARDALPLDDVAFAVLPASKPVRVLLVSTGNWFLEKLLAADSQIAFELLAPDAFQLAMAAKFDVVILDEAAPANLDLAGLPGNFLFLKKSPFTADGAPIDQPLVTDVDAQHPALRLVNLQNVTILRASPAKTPEAANGWSFTSPLRSFDHPLLITGTRRIESGERRAAALAFDIGESDLPLRVAFPLLIANTVHWLAGDEAPAPLALRCGETLPLSAEQAVNDQPQLDATKKPAAAQLVRGSFQPSRNGFYAVTKPNGSDWLAVNTFSASESDLRDAASAAKNAELPPVLSLAAATVWPAWQYLAFAALLLSTLEWWLFHRRRTE